MSSPCRVSQSRSSHFSRTVRLSSAFAMIGTRVSMVRCSRRCHCRQSQVRAAVYRPKVPAGVKTKPDSLTFLVANLKQRGSGRPRTLKTLTSSVAALFLKSVSETELAHLIQELRSTGKVSVNEVGKVSYVSGHVCALIR